MLENSKTLAEYNVFKNATLYLTQISNKNKKINFERLDIQTCDKIAQIKISQISMKQIIEISINQTYDCTIQLPDVIFNLIWEFSQTIGGLRNTDCKWSKLFDSVKKGTLEQV